MFEIQIAIKNDLRSLGPVNLRNRGCGRHQNHNRKVVEFRRTNMLASSLRQKQIPRAINSAEI